MRAARSRTAAGPPSNRRRPGPLGADRDDRSIRNRAPDPRRRRRRSSLLVEALCARDEGRRPPGAASRSDEAAWTVSARARLPAMSLPTSANVLDDGRRAAQSTLSPCHRTGRRPAAGRRARRARTTTAAIRRLREPRARLRRRRPALGRAAEELAQPGSPPNRHRPAARVRRPRGPAGAGVDARMTRTRRCNGSRSAPSCRSARPTRTPCCDRRAARRPTRRATRRCAS